MAREQFVVDFAGDQAAGLGGRSLISMKTWALAEKRKSTQVVVVDLEQRVEDVVHLHDL
jgi:hypothetical protein